jgi:uncharacterized membrane protein
VVDLTSTPEDPARTTTNRVQVVFRILLGITLLTAGVRHLTTSRTEFLAQVPDWVPVEADLVVVLSGFVEILLGAALILLPRHRVLVGWVVAAFFVVIFPGNVSQFVDGNDAFGLDSDLSRGIRLAFQPVLVVWALWSTGAWTAWRSGSGLGTRS